VNLEPPERRRALIIGGGPTGMSVAYHLGEHSLLLERQDLEHHHDYSHDLPLGPAHGGAMGDEDAGADGHGHTTPAERKALYISCSASTHSDAGEHTLIHVERWQPPDLAAPRSRDEFRTPPAVRTLRPLLRGELRLGAQVVRVSPSAHLLELADGHRYVYDKLVSTLSLPAIEMLVEQDLPKHVRRDESLRYWLSERDIEVADRDSQGHYGDIDDFAAGKRIADLVRNALAEKFGRGRATMRNARLFRPRLVNAPLMP